MLCVCLVVVALKLVSSLPYRGTFFLALLRMLAVNIDALGLYEPSGVLVLNYSIPSFLNSMVIDLERRDGLSIRGMFYPILGAIALLESGETLYFDQKSAS